MSCQRPKRISACIFIGTKPSSQSAIGGVSTRSSSSGMAARSSSAASSAASLLAQEHRAVDLEVVVVRPVERVEVHRSLARQELLVGRDRVGVAGDDPPVVPAQHVDVGRHVPQVAARPAPAPRSESAARRARSGWATSPSGGCTCAARRDAPLPAGLLQGPLQHPPRLRRCARRRPARRSAGPTAATASGSSARRRTARRCRGRPGNRGTPRASRRRSSSFHAARIRPAAAGAG